MMHMLFVIFISQINVYFENDNLPHQLSVAVSRATYSLDIAFHQLYENEVIDSIISAHERGVRVRVITEHDYYWGTARLRAAGIPVVDEFNDPNVHDHRMHDKFVIIDFRDSDTTNDMVWNGSYNASNALHADNALLISSHAMAAIFESEFNQMWGDTGDVPDPQRARTGTDKHDVAPFHTAYVNGTQIDVYFSPQDYPIQYVRQAAQSAHSSLDFCIFYYTYRDLAEDMGAGVRSGVRVRGVIDSSSLDYSSYIFDLLRSYGADVVVSNVPPPYYYLHHKFMVVDDSIVVTGSMNWTVSGTSYNDENIMVIHSRELAGLYENEFLARFQEAGSVEEETLIEPAYQLTANPTVFRSTVRFNLKGVSVYDVRGRRVAKVNGIEFDGSALPAGVYFAVKGHSRIKLIKF